MPTLALAEALESELALLSAELEAATHRQLTLIRELEPTQLWAVHGATSYTAWLGWRIGLAPAAAREKVRASRALARLPAIDAAFASARLSYSKVRAMTRVADASNEEALVEMALHSTAAQRASAGARWTDETLLPRWNGRAPDYRACVTAGLPRAIA